jgi:hypothetical protein
MRPYPDEILRSMQYSLKTYVIPHVGDKWGSYVAKTMVRMLKHVELRWKLEGPLLLADIADLRTVLGALRQTLATAPFEKDADAGKLANRIDAALAETRELPSGYLSVEALTGIDEVLRETLVAVIETCDLLAERGLEQALAPTRAEIRSYLRREVDRDNQLVEPTFMSFAPPSAGDEG